MINMALEVIEAGLAVTIQDNGRLGYRHIGVPIAGVLDSELMCAANHLLGNHHDDAVLEICLSGPVLQANIQATGIRLSIVGSITAELITNQGHHVKGLAWQTVTLKAGDRIKLSLVTQGTGYVGISGGFQVPCPMNSRSTYARAQIGGIEGRALRVGDYLPCHGFDGNLREETYAQAVWPSQEPGPIRVLLGPQDDYFSQQAIAKFVSTPYQVTRDWDRMALRLAGEPLSHSALGSEIISDGVVPGAIQVPANGQPIILMADCQTTGGYPKIATVIRADLPRLAHVRAGDNLFFQPIDHKGAEMARQARRALINHWCQSVTTRPLPNCFDEATLLTENLISGAIRGDDEELISLGLQ